MSKTVCCMSRNTASIVIGCLGSIWSTLMIICMSIELTNTLKEEGHMNLVIMCSIIFVVNVFKLISSILLIVGTTMKRHLLVLPWLIVTVIGLIFTFSSSIYTLCIAPPDGPMGEAQFMVSFGLTMWLNIYFFNVILELYKDIKAIRKQGLPMILENEDQ